MAATSKRNLAIAGLLAASALSLAQLEAMFSEPEMIVGEEVVYIVHPEQALGNQAIQVSWSPSGRYLMFIEFNGGEISQNLVDLLSGPPPPNVQPEDLLPASAPIKYWDADSGRLGTIDSVQLENGQMVTSVHWLTNTEAVIVIRSIRDVIYAEELSLRRVNFANGTVSSIGLGSLTGQLVSARGSVALSPGPTKRKSLTFAALSEDSTNIINYRSVHPGGEVSELRSLEVPPEAASALAVQPLFFAAGSAESGETYFAFRHYSSAENTFHFVLSPEAALSVHPGEPPRLSYREPHPSPELWIAKEDVKDANGASIEAVFLRSSGEIPLPEGIPFDVNDFASDGIVLAAGKDAYATVSPTKKAVAVFGLDRAITIRRLSTADKELMAQAQRAAIQTMAVSNLKQVALAAMMYSADNDDMLPSGNIESVLMPYTKNEELFKGVQWVFPGGSQREIEKPAETPIAHLDLPWGRATAYADGHVTWHGDQN
jgi:hypothetical protein